MFTNYYLHHIYHACICTQSCQTLFEPMDSSPPGSSVHGILQARILEWVAISYSTFIAYLYINIYIYIYLYTCHILMCAESLQSCPTLCDRLDCSPPGSPVLGCSPGKTTGVSCHALLQGIFLTHWSWWWTGRLSVLQSMEPQRVEHDWATELNWEKRCHSVKT